MYKRPLPPAARLQHLLDYDPATGDLRWKNPTCHNCSPGVITCHSHGYRVVTVDKVTYLQHRVIWVMQTGSPPPDGLMIDHIDENPGNNRWSNLRLLTCSENVARSSKFSHRHLVSQRSSGTWLAYTKASGKSVYLGTYSTEAAARELDQSSRTYRTNGTDTGPRTVRVRRTSSGRYEARVTFPLRSGTEKRVHLGTFDTEQQALNARIPDSTSSS